MVQFRARMKGVRDDDTYVRRFEGNAGRESSIRWHFLDSIQGDEEEGDRGERNMYIEGKGR